MATKRNETYGYTADQIVRKLCSDAYAISIVGDLLKNTSGVEIKKLLLMAIPDKYETFEIFDSDDRQQELSALRAGFRAAFKATTNEIRTEVTQKVATLVREGSGDDITLYIFAFFKAADMSYLSADDKGIVKTHLLVRMKDDISSDLLSVMDGIGKYIVKDDVNTFIDALVRMYLNDKSAGCKTSISHFLSSEMRYTVNAVDVSINNRLDEWYKTFKDKGNETPMEFIGELQLQSDPFADE